MYLISSFIFLLMLTFWNGAELGALPPARVLVQTDAIPTDIPQQPERVVVDEMLQLDRLIAVTEAHLAAQRSVRQQLEEYQLIRLRVLRDPQDNEQLYKQSLMAKRILDQIENNHLDQLFSSAFLSELNLFARVITRHALPRS